MTVLCGTEWDRYHWVYKVTVLCGTAWDRDSLAVSGDGVVWDSVGQRLLGVSSEGVHDVSGGPGELLPLLSQSLHCLHQPCVGLQQVYMYILA